MVRLPRVRRSTLAAFGRFLAVKQGTRHQLYFRRLLLATKEGNRGEMGRHWIFD